MTKPNLTLLYLCKENTAEELAKLYECITGERLIPEQVEELRAVLAEGASKTGKAS